MTQGIHQLTANMVNQLNRVDVVSNNLANVNTVGFKEDSLVEGSFNRYLREKTQNDEPTLKESVIMDTIPKIDGSFKNETLGSLRSTSNPFDFAITDQNMFFKVKNTQGDIEYTRDGSFKVDDGRLITQNGYSVLDINDQEIDINNPAFATTVALVSSGFNNLDKVGSNNYIAKDESEVTTLAETEQYLKQRYLEQSNVNTIKTMVGLIEAQRQFEQSEKAIKGIDEINGKVISSVGNDQ